MIFELIWLDSLLTAPITAESVLSGMPWHKVITHRHNQKKKKDAKNRKKKQDKISHHQMMARRAVRHLRHMQQVQNAIRQQQRARQTSSSGTSGGGSTPTSRGIGMNQDIVSRVGVAKQKMQERVRKAQKPKDIAARQQLNALRHKTHASRERARQRSAQVFGKGR